MLPNLRHLTKVHFVYRANSESQQAAMKLTFCENQLKAKSKDVTGTSSDYQKDEINLKKYEQDVSQLEVSSTTLFKFPLYLVRLFFRTL